MLIRISILKGFMVFLVVLLLVITPCIVYASANSIDMKVVVIDAGHGGIDGGVSHGDLIESDINLDIARRLERILTFQNVTVVMTRTNKDAIGDNKKKDMKKRREIIRQAKSDMVVSIHTNKFADTKRRGVQVFFDDTKKWERDGVIMQNVLNTYINSKYARRTDISPLGGDYFLTKCDDVPSLIVECGFISNNEDRALLQDETYKEELAKAIAMGINGILSY